MTACRTSGEALRSEAWRKLRGVMLEREINLVVKNDNCCGCGGCALISTRVSMELASDGFLRPHLDTSPVEPSVDKKEAQTFKRVCPGRRLAAPTGNKNLTAHPIFGSYVSVWEGSAADESIRHAGSSGGVLTALGVWLTETQEVETVTASRPDGARPTRTVPAVVTSRAEALQAAGSRYAPVSNLAAMDLAASSSVLVGKPCEISAASQYLSNESNGALASRPILLSFFCAGTPSQSATDDLVQKLGMRVEDVSEMRYRGQGWPGRFQVRSGATTAEMSYQESWGKHLGRQVQWRCKLCVDGVGQHADIAVGDYWKADERGFPKFDNSDGNSVIIARTARGHDLLQRAVRAGIIQASPLDLDRVSGVQPLQVLRRITLPGRLLGRLLAGKRIPRYTGYGLVMTGPRLPVQNLRAAAGTFARSLRLRSNR